jgi:ribosomal protein S21
MNKKSFFNTVGLSLVLYMFSTLSGFSQESPLQKFSNYKTHPAGKRVDNKSAKNGVLTESVEAENYKRPQNKRKVKRAGLETSSNPKRNYKMPKR